MTEARNLDDLIVKETQRILNGDAIPAVVEQPPQQAIQQPQNAVESKSPEPVSPSLGEVATDDPYTSLTAAQDQSHQESNQTVQQQTQQQEQQIDEYGNPIAKPKLYTDEEVQELIRKRLERQNRNQYEAKNPNQYKPAQNDQFNQEETNEEDWKKQLDAYLDDRLQRREQELNEKRWRETKEREQALFEQKFTSGMNKYTDFYQVIAGKPITDAMLLATKALENPAAFIYNAAKAYPNEINRIASINDPVQQAMEVGRLHEKMVKARALASKAPEPLTPPKSDMAQVKVVNQKSIEDRIQEYAQQKLRR